jgi:hypothetical protein
MTSAMVDLYRLAHRAVANQGESVPQGRPPRRRPVDHEGKPGPPRGGEEGVGSGQVRRHRLLHHDGKPAVEGAHAKVGGGAVVREQEHGVQVAPVQEGVVAVVNGDDPVRAFQPCAQSRVGLSHRGHRAEVARRQRRQVGPDVVVAEPDYSDSQACHAFPRSPGAARVTFRALRPGVSSSLNRMPGDSR